MQCMLIDLPVDLRSSLENIVSHDGDDIRSIDRKIISHGFHNLRDTEHGHRDTALSWLCLSRKIPVASASYGSATP